MALFTRLPYQSHLLRVALLTTFFCANDAIAHGMSPTVMVAITTAFKEKCVAEHVEFKSTMENSYARWKERNNRSFTQAINEPDFRKAVEAFRESYNEQGQFPLEYCQKFAASLGDAEKSKADNMEVDVN